MGDPFITIEDAGGIRTMTLQRPGSLNALSDGMLAAMQEALDDVANCPEIRVVVLRGSGKAFCAGHDLREMQAARQSEDQGAATYVDLFSRCTKVMLSIRNLPQPVIAQVHGIATAAGCQLVASCDLAVAAESTRFGVNGVNIGLFCSTPMVALSRNIPRKQAFEMLTTGEFLSAEKAETLGLINRVAPDGEEAAAARTLAETISAKLGSVVKIGKEAFYQQLDMPIEEAYGYTGDVMVQNLAFRDTEEGMQAFIEKRKPDWAE